MNITNKQLQILVDEIYKDKFQGLREKEDKELANEKAAVKLTKEEEKVVTTYVDSHNKYQALIKSRYSYNTQTIKSVTEEILRVKRNDLHKDFKSTIPTKTDIESALVLATVDAKDMTDLLNAVKAKFKFK